MSNNTTRRRLLAGSAIGVSSLAGCLGISSITGDEGTSNREPSEGYRPRRPPNRPPDEPAAEIHTHDGDDSFMLHTLPYFEQYYERNNVAFNYYEHPDSRSIRVNVDDSTIAVTFPEMKLDREIDITAHYMKPDGSVGKTDPVTLSPESGDFQSYTCEFSVSGRNYPRRKRARFLITATDYYFGTPVDYLLKEHRVAIIPYTNSTGTDDRYVQSEALNYHSVSKYEHNSIEPNELYTEYVDTNRERTLFFVLTHPHLSDEFYTGYSNVAHDAYEEYVNNMDDESYRVAHHPITYMYNAEDFEYLTTLADSLRASLDANGVNSHFQRLQKLGHFIGCFDYKPDRFTDIPAYSIYNTICDCTSATILFLSLTTLPAFNNTRGALIACTLHGEGHLTVGIDERDLHAPNSNDIYWVEPSQFELNNGIPDTRYAFLELTRPRAIGEYDESDYVYEYLMDTSELDLYPDLRNF